MHSEKLSLKEARHLMLASQKLIGATPSSLQIIEHLGYIQIDTISVVERAHHHVFWSRNPKYKPSELEDLVAARNIFEYWSHAASYLPMKDYRYTLPLKKEFSKKDSAWLPRDMKVMKRVLKRIKEEGPLRSKDFENLQNLKHSGWWDWKPAKKALERLFLEGKLEVTRREGFHKVYDLTERVIPNFVNIKEPTPKEYLRYLIRRTIRHHGLTTASEVAYLRKKTIKTGIEKELKEMLNSNEIVSVTVEGISETYYTDPDLLKVLPRVNSKVLLLSPFDNLVIQRKKLKRFFNFDYQIECYVPKSKRKYGYFSLPAFSGLKPLARIDCKADRGNKKLLVQSVHYEKGTDQDFFAPKLDKKLKSFAKFNKCQKVEY